MKLNESQLRKIIKESVKDVLNNNIEEKLDEIVYESLWHWINSIKKEYYSDFNDDKRLNNFIAFQLQAAQEELERI